MSHVQQIPLKEGLWTVPASPDEKPQLLGSQCRHCGEIFFPKKEKGLCLNCLNRGLDDIKLSRKGRIHSFTTVMQRPPIYYKGPVPYMLAWVELDEGLRLETLLTDCEPEDVTLGMEVELIIDKLHTDEQGNDVITYKFKPVGTSKAGTQ